MRTLIVLVAAAMLAVAACSPAAQATSAAASAAAPAAASAAAPAAASATPGGATGGSAVVMETFAFSPATITVAAGTTVTWTNKDTAAHTVTADDGSFDSKSLATGATFSQAFPKAGTYAYHCAIHTSMTATVVVQ